MTSRFNDPAQKEIGKMSFDVTIAYFLALNVFLPELTKRTN